jgi:tellurite methyltransferase
MFNDKKYWNDWYANHRGAMNETPFSRFCLGFFYPSKRLIDVGCGNGRDSFFFARKGFDVLGVDYSKVAISQDQKTIEMKNLTFLECAFSNLKNYESKFDYFYSRFSLHANDETAQHSLLNWECNNLNTDVLVCIEARSIMDEISHEGKQLGHRANYTDHYRRFIVFEELVEELNEVGFEVLYKIQSNGLAIYKDEDPVVIRIIARK